MPADDWHLMRALDQHAWQVRPAYAHSCNLKQHLTGARAGFGHIFQTNVAGGVKNCCAHCSDFLDKEGAAGEQRRPQWQGACPAAVSVPENRRTEFCEKRIAGEFGDIG